MAITKIRRISTWTLLACTIATLVILGLFFWGGNDEPYKGELWNPHYAGLLLNWIYLLFAITIVAVVIFALWQFFVNFKQNPKGGLAGLSVIVLFGGLLFITYTTGSGTPLALMNEDVQQYNIPFWLKVTDMWLFSTYVLIILVVLTIIVGSVRKILSK
ncbi:MAG: hypothetical protein LBT78_01505 [Tannerella sp.]|jgi:hypothetical protein|nr:hypothetical protein [Tannerella sp.]